MGKLKTNRLINNFPSVLPRQPYYDDQPNGLQESDNDYFHNNAEAAIWLLDHASDILEILKTIQQNR